MTLAVDIPRSILKQRKPKPELSVSTSPEPHVVHFPPSPCVTKTYEMHSSSLYDRSPIVVAPNSCAMPARGCPGRTYYERKEGDDDEYTLCTRFLQNAESRELKVRGHAHPRALERRADSNDIPSLPLLIPDSSSTSESEESDGFVSPIPVPHSCSMSFTYPPPNNVALFPPEPFHPSLLSSVARDEQFLFAVPVRGRRSSPTTALLFEDMEEDPGYVEDNELATTPKPTRRSSLSPPRLSPTVSGTKKKKGCRFATASRCTNSKASGFEKDPSKDDDGCLGGF